MVVQSSRSLRGMGGNDDGPEEDFGSSEVDLMDKSVVLQVRKKKRDIERESKRASER